MVLRVDVMDAALRGFYGVDPVDLRSQRRVIALTPTGRVLDDRLVDELAAEPDITLLCGRYEGFDERIVEHFASDAISIGEYVLAGGELAAMVVCDAVLRKLPGSLGDSASAREESFSVALEGRPEYPHYTRPAAYRGWQVPEVLLSGHHEQIRRWREERSVERADLAGRDAAAAAERTSGGRASSDRAAAASARAASGDACGQPSGGPATDVRGHGAGDPLTDDGARACDGRGDPGGPPA
jgi:tRNA (guanine37-N1)-methyltransferase